jgi:acyl-CoA reductase-like NAD-dependent aldehyde dehydrogenase
VVRNFGGCTLTIDPATTTGPVISVAAAERIRKQVDDAVVAGGKLEIPRGTFVMDKPGTTFVGPQVVTSVTHEMSDPFRTRALI